MGLFSSVKKAVKKVAKKVVGGVKKVFNKAMKFVGKIAGSKWGKALLLASAVFTGGAALAAGWSTFAGTTGTFMTKFVAGGKAFAAALANPMAAAKKVMGGAAATGQAATVGAAAQGAQAAQAGQAAGQLAGAAGTSVASGSGAAMQTLAGAAQPAAQAAGAAATGAQAAGAAAQGAQAATQAAGAGGGGMLSSAWNVAKTVGKGAMDIAKSPAGGQMISSAIEGYASGKQQEELLKEQERVRRYYDKQWSKDKNMAGLREQVGGYDPDLPGGYMERAQRVNKFLNQRDYKYPGGVPGGDEVAGYARSGG